MRSNLTKIIILFLFFLLTAVSVKSAYSFYLKETQQQELEGRALENKKCWTKILKGMPAEQIKDILGEPERVTEGATAIWFYQKGGSVELSEGKVIKWVKPYTWDY